jgi:hypothetical protein
MSFWIVLWKVVLVGGVLAFAGMSVCVAIGGYRDLKKMFARVRGEEQETE